MAATSIIQIDVHDEKFKAFAKAFEKYKEALNSTNKTWKSQDEASEKRLKSQKTFLVSAGNINQVLRNTAKISGEIARNFASVAISITKWVAFGALGGGFGLGALAASAADQRRRALGLGVTTGQNRAANVNYSKFIDVESALSNIADIKGDIGRRQILTNFGAKEGQNPAEMLPEIMKQMTALFKSKGETQQHAEAYGLTQIFSMDELRRMANSEDELNAAIEQAAKDIKKLHVSDADSRAWQSFWTQLGRAGNLLETGLIKALTPLVPWLEKLSDVVATAIVDFAGSDRVKDALERFTAYLGSDDAKKDIHNFLTFVGMLGRATKSLIETLIEVRATFKSFFNFVSNVADIPSKLLKDFKQPDATDKSLLKNYQSFVEKKREPPKDKFESKDKNILKNYQSFIEKKQNFYNFEKFTEKTDTRIKDSLETDERNWSNVMVPYDFDAEQERAHQRRMNGQPYKNSSDETQKQMTTLNVNVHNASGGDLVVTANAMK
jgi:hypothetical protein